MLFFTALLYGLFLFNQQQSLGESNQDYKNIQTDQIGFQESLNQSKLKIVE